MNYSRERARREALARRRRKLRRSRNIGFFFAAVALILSIVVVGFIFYLDVLPFAYTAAIILLLTFLVGYGFLSQYTRSFRTVGKVLSCLMIVVLSFAAYYLSVTTNTLGSILGSRYKTEIISVYILEESDAQTLSDCTGLCFAYQTQTAEEITKKAFAEVDKELKGSYRKAAYTSFDTLIASLYGGESDVILLNDSQLETICDSYPDFKEDTRVLASYTIKTKVETTVSPVKVTKEPFAVYISGIDVYGDISQTSRSDVNIIAFINPNTKKVLLVSTPRDSYVELSYAPGNYDKLTHVGNHGVDASMQTLSNLYDIDIHYFLRVNFTGFMDIVDAMGGITIENEESFTSHDGYYYEAGTLNLDGLHALHYARERSAFALGDVQRGKNQMKVIKAMVQKACSTTLLTHFTDIMQSLTGCMETNMSMDDISRLVKAQIKNNTPWDIQSLSLDGYSDYRYTYSYSDMELSVYILDEESVQDAKDAIQAIMKGEDYVVPED